MTGDYALFFYTRNANKHYPIFVQYHQRKYLSYSRLHGAYVERCFGSAQQNEEGVTAVLIDKFGEVKWKDGAWSVNALLCIILIQKIQTEKRNKKNVKVYYIQGTSAMGKSEKAEEIVKQWYLDKGFEEEDEIVECPCVVAIFDDFRAGIMKPEESINLIDYRVHNLNIKGSSCSVFIQRLSSIYSNVEDFERHEQ
ncbi:hypothetical protein H8356DRAFT_1324225 [Neocallimastix lanati (nom. inval.)]|nr:hypothetical protein H8356DRAFT_1324225 [Neocallimastix sp. JGI-2020a]